MNDLPAEPGFLPAPPAARRPAQPTQSPRRAPARSSTHAPQRIPQSQPSHSALRSTLDEPPLHADAIGCATDVYLEYE